MVRLIALLAALTLAGCAAGTGADDTPSPTPTPTPDATPSAEPSLEVRTPAPSRGIGGGDELTGRLGADSVEGGCAYLQTDDGTRYEVLYPEGWRVRTAPVELRNPEGEVVARGGDTVTVRGREAGDMASICMIGPIFRASEVVSVDD